MNGSGSLHFTMTFTCLLSLCIVVVTAIHDLAFSQRLTHIYSDKTCLTLVFCHKKLDQLPKDNQPF